MSKHFIARCRYILDLQLINISGKNVIQQPWTYFVGKELVKSHRYFIKLQVSNVLTQNQEYLVKLAVKFPLVK